MRKKEYDAMYKVEDTHFWYRGMRKISETLLEKYFLQKTNARILDAGCGTGAGMMWLKSFGTIFGFDISQRAIYFCKKRGLKNVKLGSIEKIPYDKSHFDLVVSFDVLGQRQLKNDQTGIREINKVLKKDGIAMIRVAAFDWLYSYHDKAVQTKHRYTKNEVRKLLQSNGFTILKISYANMFLFPISLVMRFADKALSSSHKTSDVKPVQPILNDALYIPLWLESKLLRIISLPFGLWVIAIAKKN